MSNVLLLTGAIIPKYQNGINRSDKNIRINDYQIAITKWFKNDFFDKIVFCDNSGLDINDLKKELCSGENNITSIIDKIEILTLNDKPNLNLHYGYSELGIIDYALANSKFLKESTYFTKCTGRLFYPQYNQLFEEFEKNFTFYVDARSNFLWYKNQQITTQLMIFKTKFYEEELLNTRNEMTVEDYFIERFFYRKLIKYKNTKNCFFRWEKEIIAEGISGHTNTSYRGFKKTILSKIRSFFRKILPNFWI